MNHLFIGLGGTGGSVLRHLRKSLYLYERATDGQIARFARLVAQEPIDALLAVSLLPPPHSGTAQSSLARHFNDWQPLSGRQDDLRALDMLQRAIAVADNGEQPLAIFGWDDDIDGLGHAARFAHPAQNVNLM